MGNTDHKREAVETAFLVFLEEMFPNDLDSISSQMILDYVMNNIYKADPVQDVRHFMQVGGTPVAHEPTLPTVGALNLYLNLILEEVVEFAIACSPDGHTVVDVALHKALNKVWTIQDKMKAARKVANIVEALDALVDLQYVMHNATNGLGLHKVFHDGHDLVHASNMSKFATNAEDAAKTLDDYKAQNKEAYIELVLNLFVVKRKEDGKILKAACWKEADLQPLISLPLER